MSRTSVAACGFVVGVATGFGIAAYLTIRYLELTEPKAVVEQAYVHRSLSLRIDNIDKLSRGRGDRYRVFDCREVKR